MEHKPAQDVKTHSNISKDILDDLSSRFIINAPEEERKDVVRLCFQIELAHWFYLDFYCSESPFSKQCGMREFAKIILNHIPSLRDHAANVDNIYDQWREYKLTVPTYGAIMLDQTMENVLLVQSYFAKASWGFPKGKVNEEEDPHRCAVREVLEETGFDIGKLVNSKDYIEIYIGKQLIRLYLVTGVPKDFEFKPKTRNEIKAFKWFPVYSLPATRKDTTCKHSTGFGPNAFFMVTPFVHDLRKWISDKQHKLRRSRSKTTSDIQLEYESSADKLTVQQQQKQFASTCQKSYSEFLNIIQAKSKPMKSLSSSAPRMLKGRELKNENRANDGPSTSNNDSTLSSLKFVDGSRYDFSSSAWTNFKFDRRALMRAFD